MVTPFGGRKVPVVLTLLLPNAGGVSLTSYYSRTLTANTTSHLLNPIVVDWSKINGDAYLDTHWAHAAMSTAGNAIMVLYNYTAGSALVTSSSNTSSATDTDMSTGFTVVASFTKPTATAEVGILVMNKDSSARTLKLEHSRIWVV